MNTGPDLIIDATDARLGRMATHAAKAALQGKRVAVINCGEAIITGQKSVIVNEYVARRQLGRPTKGPFPPRMSDRFVRRTIRSMLPYKSPRGREAFSRVECYIDAPEGYAAKAITLENTPSIRAMKVKELCKLVGGKA